MSSVNGKRKGSSWERRLKGLGYTNYAQYLRSPHWNSFCVGYHYQGLIQRCIGCGAHEYLLHHVTYRRLAKEDYGDVIPVCKSCHRRIHNTAVPLDCPEKALQQIFGWTDEERDKRFSPEIMGRFLDRRKKDWDEKAKAVAAERARKKQKKKVASPPAKPSYPRLSRYHRDIKEYVRSGYSYAEISEIFKVPHSHVAAHINKHLEEFSELQGYGNIGTRSPKPRPQTQRNLKKEVAKQPKDRCSYGHFHKVSRYHDTFKGYLQQGWTVFQIARAFNVSEKYVEGYMESNLQEFSEWIQKK